MDDVTRILTAIEQGDPEAASRRLRWPWVAGHN